MKIITVAIIAFLAAGCASSPKIHDANQAQLNLPFIAKKGQWVEIYPYGASPEEGPTIMQVTKVNSDLISGDHVSIAGDYMAVAMEKTFGYDEIETIQVSRCDPRAAKPCGDIDVDIDGYDALEAAAFVGVLVLRAAWCMVQVSAALEGSSRRVNC